MALRSSRPLWLFFVATSAVLVAVVSTLATSVRQRAAIAEVTRLGGNAQTTQGGSEWIRKVVGHRLMSVLDRATVVNLSGTETTDADLEILDRLRGIERLALARTKVTDGGMPGIGRLTGLKDRRNSSQTEWANWIGLIANFFAFFTCCLPLLNRNASRFCNRTYQHPLVPRL